MFGIVGTDIEDHQGSDIDIEMCRERYIDRYTEM